MSAASPSLGEYLAPACFLCRERACRGQVTLTTKTPFHATKLPLALWVQAIYLVLGSSKGLSSAVLARILGVSQRPAWKMGHAIRELLAGFYANADKLAGTVEVDTFYTGGSPKKHDRGSSTSTWRPERARGIAPSWSPSPAMGPRGRRSFRANRVQTSSPF